VRTELWDLADIRKQNLALPRGVEWAAFAQIGSKWRLMVWEKEPLDDEIEDFLRTVEKQCQ
jgi:hypothetical protein